MSKRGRKTSWWGWDYFEQTSEKSDGGNSLYQCKVKAGGLDVEGNPIVCAELLSYSGSPTPFKTHLSSRHREFYAKMKAEKSETSEGKPRKQPKLTELGVKVERSIKSESSSRDASEEEKRQLGEDLLSYVVDDLRGASSVEGLLLSIYLNSNFQFLLGRGFKVIATRGRPRFPDNMFKREHINELIHDEALKIRKEYMPIYKITASDRSLTTDFYTAKNQAEIMVLTSHGFDANWNLTRIFLGGRYSNTVFRSHLGHLDRSQSLL
jgi:hypothetical protein